MAAINNAGGSGFAVTDERRLLRFLILGSEGGTYYTSERKLTLENADAIYRLIESGKGDYVVATLVDVSTNGRAPKQAPTLFALAMVAAYGSDKERTAAYNAVPVVCRTPTMLFEFIDFRLVMKTEAKDKRGGGKGWGSGMRKAIFNVYLRDPYSVALAVTKYRQRDGWTHRDVLKLAHTKPATPHHRLVFHYIVKGDIPKLEEVPGFVAGDEALVKIHKFLRAVDIVRSDGWVSRPERIAELIEKRGLVREHIHSSMLSSRTVWFALLKEMPLTALIRNLGKMTNIGLFKLPSALSIALIKLADAEALGRARVHPMTILIALTTYKSGRGDKGKLAWDPDASISGALEKAFYLSFGNVKPTGKRYLLGLDVSGSMTMGGVCGSSLTPRDASAAMAMVTMRTEKCRVMAFSHELVPLPITPDDDLTTAVRIMSSTPMGATDCSLPMVWALKNRVEVDVFVIYTDNETWAGKVKPHVALREYRAKMGIDARLAVVAMTSGGFSIADPEDGGMLDVVGFDTATPQIMREFALGGI